MKHYTVSDGRIVLNLQEADTIQEAFRNARDALKSLSASRKKLLKKLQLVPMH